MKALCDRQLVCSIPDVTPSFALVQSLSMSSDSLPDSYTADEQFASALVPQLSSAEIASKQHADRVISHVIAQLETGKSSPPSLREELLELPLLL